MTEPHRNDELSDIFVFTGAARPKPPGLPDAEEAEAREKAGRERSVHEKAKFTKEEEAKARAAIVAPPPSARIGFVNVYELPFGINYISSSLKVDEPFTPMRVGQLFTFFMKPNPLTGTNYWTGVTHAEIFYPISGEKPESCVGSKAYEVVLKQPVQDVREIVRENVTTTGRIIGVVDGYMPHEMVSIRIADWFLKNDMFKMGNWERKDETTALVPAENRRWAM